MPQDRSRVVYLIGAGATHGAAAAAGSALGTLTRDLCPAIAVRVRELYEAKYGDDRVLGSLVNSAVDDDTDYEHIITFLDQSVSSKHRGFAEDLRLAYEEVLRARLGAVNTELGAPPTALYSALIDLYQLDGFRETLSGILSLNYDDYLERAIEEELGLAANFGVRVEDGQESADSILLLKLHGSFGWKDSWPIRRLSGNSARLWIPPGIRKAKEIYPFNLLWGLARQVLDCDILRIIGCNLGPNDWDLISLLFTTRFGHDTGLPYTIEVVNSPQHAIDLQKAFPYLTSHPCSIPSQLAAGS